MPADKPGVDRLTAPREQRDRLLRDRLWERFKSLALTLKHQCATRTGCYVGINEQPQVEVFFRVERCGVGTNVIALTAGPDLGGDDRLGFQVRIVAVTNGTISSIRAERLPVSYDAERDRFTIQTTSPIEERQMAEFFLACAERLLPTLQPA